MIDYAALRTSLTNALSEHLGTYTFSGSLETPAIRVDDGSDPYQEEPAVSGLECVIQPQIEVPVTMLLGGYQQNFTTLIFLKQWDITKTTLEAMPLVLSTLAEFPELTIGNPRRIIRSTRLDNIETMAIPATEAIAIYFEE